MNENALSAHRYYFLSYQLRKFLNQQMPRNPLKDLSTEGFLKAKRRKTNCSIVSIYNNSQKG